MDFNDFAEREEKRRGNPKVNRLKNDILEGEYVLDDSNVDITLIDALKNIFIKSCNSKFNEDVLKDIPNSTRCVEEKIGVTGKYAMAISIVVFLHYEQYFMPNVNLLFDYFGMKKIESLNYISIFDTLCKKELLTKCVYDGNEQYFANDEVINAVEKNVKFEPVDYKSMNLFEVLSHMRRLLSNVSNTPIKDRKGQLLKVFYEVCDNFETFKKINELYFSVFDGNQSLIEDYDTLSRDKNEVAYGISAIWILISRVIFSNYGFDRSDLVEHSLLFYDGSFNFELGTPDNRLILDDILEYQGEGVRDVDSYLMTRSFEELVKKDYPKILPRENNSSSSLKKHNDIVKKEMFYNKKEETELSRISNIMKPENYANLVSSLKERGMRTGVTILFHGGPGTGKTETVYQLARESGRDLFEVNVANLKSCWVGESEKNFRELFRTYEIESKECERKPILFFNEADAIFGIRNEGADRAADKMENSIQNILLDEMEKFQGILIATTNLTKSFDSAFERRFLFKVLFEKPCLDAKASIWKSMIEGLSSMEAKNLAEVYDFSGGQIENISRKYIIEELLNGKKPSYDDILDFCNEENISKRAVSMGFKCNK